MVNKNLCRFDKAAAPGGHNDTILAGNCLPEGINAPFDAAWGYLEGKSMMEPHSHPTDEIYTVFKGKGYCHIDGERIPIVPGDILRVPPDAMHTMECCEGDILQWAAFWWEVK